MKYCEVTADNVRKAGWSWGCVSAIDSNGRTIWIADAHRGDGKRFVVISDYGIANSAAEKLSQRPRDVDNRKIESFTCPSVHFETIQE